MQPVIQKHLRQPEWSATVQAVFGLTVDMVHKDAGVSLLIIIQTLAFGNIHGFTENGGCRTHLAFFHGASCARCLGLETVNGIRGCSGRPGSFVSPWERGGLALEYAK